MFEGKKTFLFWIGLIILGLASVFLLEVTWRFVILDIQIDRFVWLKYRVPSIVGFFVFVLIGLYIMRSGVEDSSLRQKLAVSMENRRITVYVKSLKTQKVTKVDSSLPPRLHGSDDHLLIPYPGERIVVDDYVLPPEHREAINLVKSVSGRYGYTVEIVDMAKENIGEKLIEEIKGLDTIPTIKTNLGGKLERSQITKENVELLLVNEMRECTKQRLVR